MYKFQNLNQALIGMAKECLDKGVTRKTRGFDCIEIPYPVLICIENPTDRYVNIPQRKWNKTLGFIESLWIGTGTNHMGMVLPYVKNMAAFSDNGDTMRAAYGPRLRAFSGLATDYVIADPKHRHIVSGFVKTVDQFKFVIESLQRDPNSRQAVMTIHDPVKDDFDENNGLKVTKDTPCCRSVQFMVVDGKLDCTLHIRSNDLIWGFSAVNVFNFTFMQEYIAGILGLPVGKYYHFANNLHFYSDKMELVKELAELHLEDYPSEFGRWEYSQFNSHQIKTLEGFDQSINALFKYEEGVREDNFLNNPPFINAFFYDWAVAIHNHWKENKLEFKNPYLNKLHKEMKTRTRIVKNLTPGMPVMCVTRKDNGELVGFYSANDSVSGYIKKCELDKNT